MKVFKIQIMESTFFSTGVSPRSASFAYLKDFPSVLTSTRSPLMVPASALNQQDGCCSSLPHHCALSWRKRNGEVGQQQEESPPGNRGKSGCIMIGWLYNDRDVCASRVNFQCDSASDHCCRTNDDMNIFFQPRLFEMTVSISGFH